MTYPQHQPPPPQHNPQPWMPPSPQQQYAYPPVAPTSGRATASLVFALIGVFTGLCTFGLPSLVAVILGHQALKETKDGARGGHGMAIAGLILGYPGAILYAVFMVLWMIAGAENNS